MLDGLQLFSDLTESELSEVSLFCQQKTILAGETLFSFGDQANTLYVIKSGKIGVFDEDNKRLGVVGNDDILGEMTILGGEDLRTANAVALEDTTLITILGMAMEKLAEVNNEVFAKIQQIISKRRQENIDI